MTLAYFDFFLRHFYRLQCEFEKSLAVPNVALARERARDGLLIKRMSVYLIERLVSFLARNFVAPVACVSAGPIFFCRHLLSS